MGALHEGHGSLIQQRGTTTRPSSRASSSTRPSSAPNEDFTRYPRDEEADLALLESLGVDVAYLPGVEEMYPPGGTTFVDVGPLGEVLEGAARPGHFRGVATVVTKLFAMVRPHRAYFGQKDGQQSVVIQRLDRDLGLPIEIVVCPTVRESDGLALSSRNRYLTRRRTSAGACSLPSAAGSEERAAGGERSADKLRSLMLDALAPRRRESPTTSRSQTPRRSKN